VSKAFASSGSTRAIAAAGSRPTPSSPPARLGTSAPMARWSTTASSAVPIEPAIRWMVLSALEAAGICSRATER
jgi:hypothetical protein